MQRLVLGRVLAAVLFLWTALNVSAQGTAISYQGRLNDGGAPANTNYDFRFAVFDAPANGTQLSIWLTNSVVPVSNGLFSVTLDFGPGIFNGTDNGSNDWMDVAVRKSGVAATFTVLMPRQPILPVPYALFATSASNLLGTLQATQLVGTIASSVFSGVYSNTVSFSSAANQFTGTFSGNGTNLTSLNASQITGGTLADARLPGDVALLGQTQTFTGSNTFNGGVAFNGQDTFAGVNNFNNSGNTFNGNFFGNGLVGWTAVTGTSVAAARDHGYMLQSSTLTTVTLPASGTLTQVDIVRISGTGTGGWLVQKNGTQTVTGNFASFNNCAVGELTTLASDNYGVAGSADGVHLYAANSEAGSVIGLKVSLNSGRTWNAVSGLSTGSFTSVACSADGKTVYAQQGTGDIQKSTDGGVTWSSTGTAVTAGSISCPANGSAVYQGGIACSGTGAYRAEISGASVLLSLNSGPFNNSIAGPGGTLSCVAVSSDCTKILVAVNNGSLYASSNQGVTWISVLAINKPWKEVWMSPDGSHFAAASSDTSLNSGDGGIYTGNVSPCPNTSSTSNISGSQGSAVELQYISANLFMPVSSTGLLWAN